MGTIRTLLAISVLITHSEPIFGVRLLSGDMAITCFYVISGFLMALILQTRYSSASTFYVNRVLRIYPAYLIAVAASAVIFGLGLTRTHNPFPAFSLLQQNEQTGWALAFAISNLTLLGIDLSRYVAFIDFGQAYFPMFQGGAVAGTNGSHNLLFVPQAWTLAIEMQFYLLAPLLARMRTRNLALLALAFTLQRIVVFQVMRKTVAPGFDDASFFPLQIQYFLFGMLAYRLYAAYSGLNCPRFWRWAPYAAAALALAMIFFGYEVMRPYHRAYYDIFYAAFACLVPFLFHGWKDSRLDGAIGELSYPVYIFHYAAAALMHWRAEGWRGEATLAVTLVVSAAYIVGFDRWLQRRRVRIASLQPPPGARTAR